MERFIMDKLLAWKNSANRKPLVLHGARQVGKTWLLQEFGRRHFDNVAYIDFDDNAFMQAQFGQGYNIENLIQAIAADTGQNIQPDKTLIIFDEIQACPQALTALKYFRERAPQYAVAAAGSLLGLTVHEGTGFPVGKVANLHLHPLSFREFLDGIGENFLRNIIDTGNPKQINSLAAKIIPLLRQYFYIGGMPECVSQYGSGATLTEIRDIQKDILIGYQADFSKHIPGNQIEPALAAWNSIPVHLGRENKKFIFSQISEGARARDYRFSLTWFEQAGLISRVRRIKTPGLPLGTYGDDSGFKVFLLDIGLLGALAGLDERTALAGSSVFREFKGALTEQYVCQQLISEFETDLYYWSAPRSTGEIDFLIQIGGHIYPIEVKAEENLQSKSLAAFAQKHSNVLPRRFSMAGYRDENWMRNIPHWAISRYDLWE